MKSVKFFSCLVSCGIFLANPSSAMDEHCSLMNAKKNAVKNCKQDYKELIIHSHCNCDFKPKYLVFISKYSVDDQSVMVKLAQYLKNYFANSINLPKLKLFKEYFDNLKLDKRIQCIMVKLQPILDNFSVSKLIDAGVIDNEAEFLTDGSNFEISIESLKEIDEFFKEYGGKTKTEEELEREYRILCDEADGFRIYKFDSDDGISFSMVMKDDSGTYPIFNFKEKDIKKFLD